MGWFGPSGKCGCCNDRPCCSDVWDLVRAKYSAMNFVAEGATSIDRDVAIVESSGGTYQCAVGDAEIETNDSTEVLVASGVYRKDSLSDNKSYLGGSVGVFSCEPSPSMRVTVLIYYWLRYTGSPPDWTTLGFTLDNVIINGADTLVVWSYTDGNAVTGINDYYVSGAPVGTRVSVSYQGDFTPTLPDSVPFPLTVAPFYNPASFSVTLGWVV